MKWKKIISSFTITLMLAIFGATIVNINHVHAQSDDTFKSGLPESINGTWQSDLIKSHQGYVQNELIVNQYQNKFDSFTNELNDKDRFIKKDHKNTDMKNPQYEKVGINRFIIESSQDSSIKYVINFKDQNHFSLWYYNHNKVYFSGNFNHINN